MHAAKVQREHRLALSVHSRAVYFAVFVTKCTKRNILSLISDGISMNSWKRIIYLEFEACFKEWSSTDPWVSILQQVSKGAVDAVEEAIDHHVVHVINVCLPDVTAGFCFEQTKIFLQDKKRLKRILLGSNSKFHK